MSFGQNKLNLFHPFFFKEVYNYRMVIKLAISRRHIDL